MTKAGNIMAITIIQEQWHNKSYKYNDANNNITNITKCILLMKIMVIKNDHNNSDSNSNNNKNNILVLLPIYLMLLLIVSPSRNDFHFPT